MIIFEVPGPCLIVIPSRIPSHCAVASPTKGITLGIFLLLCHVESLYDFVVENLISGESPIFDSKIIVFLVNKIPVFHGKWMVPWYPEIRVMISQGAMIAATSVFPFLTSPRLCSNLQCLPAVMDGYFPGRGVTGPEFQRGLIGLDGNMEDMEGRRWISIYPLVICDSLPLKMAMKIVDLPINSMVIFHSYVNVYQRVYMFWDQRHLPQLVSSLLGCLEILPVEMI